MKRLLSLACALLLSSALADVVSTPLPIPATQAPLGQTASVDWNSQTVTVEGAATTRTGLTQAQAYLQGKAAATADAQRLLAVALAGIQVDAKTTVKDFEMQSDDIATKVRSIVRGQIVGQPRVERMPDGSSIVFVTMSAPMGSAINLLQAVRPKPPAPRIMVNITNVKIINPPYRPPSGRFSGLIIDARATAFSPCLLPRIYAQDGTLVWSYNALGTRDDGVSGYARSVSQAQIMVDRGGPNALVVQGLYADRCDVVVSQMEAESIRAYNRITGFLDNYNVTIVF
ncbi:hypothetical protein D3875_00615 [Deinococcus cavernae]|uniref:Uncharacterized protein n=1 Tax=Deinococcus cavernae TaxID=2320857 RepID=A0A418VHG7_9DEIO|nr:hypothetical protein [Deinococcus cavernae]RJF75584.1 hypothetical protein D3875_00615 [Deinococcus cavernae]